MRIARRAVIIALAAPLWAPRRGKSQSLPAPAPMVRPEALRRISDHVQVKAFRRPAAAPRRVNGEGICGAVCVQVPRPMPHRSI